MLEKQRIATQLGIEDAEMQGALCGNQHQGDSDHRCS
jgi:hypothetical protein